MTGLVLDRCDGSGSERSDSLHSYDVEVDQGSSLSSHASQVCSVSLKNCVIMRIQLSHLYNNNNKIWILFAMSAYFFDEPKFTSD